MSGRPKPWKPGVVQHALRGRKRSVHLWCLSWVEDKSSKVAYMHLSPTQMISVSGVWFGHWCAMLLSSSRFWGSFDLGKNGEVVCSTLVSSPLGVQRSCNNEYPPADVNSKKINYIIIIIRERVHAFAWVLLQLVQDLLLYLLLSWVVGGIVYVEIPSRGRHGGEERVRDRRRKAADSCPPSPLHVHLWPSLGSLVLLPLLVKESPVVTIEHTVDLSQ